MSSQNSPDSSGIAAFVGGVGCGDSSSNKNG